MGTGNHDRKKYDGVTLLMIKLQISLIWPECAQGKYIVKAKGCVLAVLRWGNKEGPLIGWGPFAYVPIDPAGNGIFSFSGRRGIPSGATHVWARCYTNDFVSYEDISAGIDHKYLSAAKDMSAAHRFSILTDLHLASRPWKIKQALRSAESNLVLLLGDSTNDGLPEQFSQFLNCAADSVPEKILLPVPGNHDITNPRFLEREEDGSAGYAHFQAALLEKAAEKGCFFTRDPCSQSWAMQLDDLDLIGLQSVVSGRKFLFPEGRQIDWLENHLTAVPAAWHIILCHAPLLAHNPNRNAGMPYLDKNKRLQELVDRHGRIIFLSGHTHVSPNVSAGNGEFDVKHQNIYLDCGSVVATDISGETGLMSPDWKDGCKTELIAAKDDVEICMSSIESGTRFPRGYYRFASALNRGEPAGI